MMALSMGIPVHRWENKYVAWSSTRHQDIYWLTGFLDHENSIWANWKKRELAMTIMTIRDDHFLGKAKKNIKQLRINCCPNCWDFFVGGFASPQLTSVRKCGYSPFNSHLSRENHGRPWDGYTSSSNRVIWATNLSLAERCSMLPPLFMLGAGYGSMANETATISYVV